MGKCFPGSCQNFDTKQVEKMMQSFDIKFSAQEGYQNNHAPCCEEKHTFGYQENVC